MPESDPSPFAICFEAALIGIGCLLIWRLVLSSRARASRSPAALAPWAIPGSDFLLFLLFVVCGGIVLPMVAFWLMVHSSLDSDARMIATAAAFQMGLLAGIAGFHFGFSRAAPTLAADPRAALTTGVATFFITMPVLAVVSLVWQKGLDLFGLPVEKQDLMDLFVNTHSPVLRGILIVCAVLVAPITEEFIFRWGLFRYLRGRVPRWLALAGPAVLFGALHVTWKTLDGLAALAPLAALGIVFSLAYERTGRISTAMVAHALFNLNTVVLILAGVNV